MKVAIHQRKGSFSDAWIEYCNEQNIPYKIVNCYDSDIIEKAKDCDVIMWHHNHAIYNDVVAAKNILFALEQSGKKVFPNFNTSWHFDNKVAQKYLFEAIGAPLVPSYVFYDKSQAKEWASNTTFPKVFKLKGGAGSANVKLVKTREDAIKLINKAFGRGFSQFDRLGYARERYSKFRNNQDTLLGVFKGIGRLIIPTTFALKQGREKGYVYFQDYIPNNSFDTRIVVIGNKAIGERRFVRKNDFRASGSGVYSYEDIDARLVKIAFEVTQRLQLQSVAFDFIFNSNNQPLIVEVSYCFGTIGISNAPGYWDSDLRWYTDKTYPEVWIIETFLHDVLHRKAKI